MYVSCTHKNSLIVSKKDTQNHQNLQSSKISKFLMITHDMFCKKIKKKGQKSHTQSIEENLEAFDLNNDKKNF